MKTALIKPLMKTSVLLTRDILLDSIKPLCLNEN